MTDDTTAQIARLETQIEAISEQIADLKRDLRSALERFENGRLLAHRLGAHDEALARLEALQETSRTQVLDLQMWRARIMGRYAVILGLVMFCASIVSGLVAAYVSSWLPGPAA